VAPVQVHHIELLAPNVLLLALSAPRGPRLRLRRRGGRQTLRTARWFSQLDHVLAAACLVDVAEMGCVAADDDGMLVVVDRTAFLPRAHELVLERLDDEEAPMAPGDLVRRVARDCAAALLTDEVARGYRQAPARPLQLRRRYELGEAEHLRQLKEHLRDVYAGRSTDHLAITILRFCSSVPLPGLLPGAPELAELRARVRALPREVPVGRAGDAATSVTAVPPDHPFLSAVVWVERGEPAGGPGG
jgi:hypothetical protein